MLDMARVHEAFEASTDFTVGIEEEFAILDPHTLSLDHRFEELKDASGADPVLAESVAGELIKSEIEIRSGRGDSFADAVAKSSYFCERISISDEISSPATDPASWSSAWAASRSSS